MRLIIERLMDKVEDHSAHLAARGRYGSQHSLWQTIAAFLDGPIVIIEQLFRPSDCSDLHGREMDGEKVRKRLNLTKNIKHFRKAFSTFTTCECFCCNFSNYSVSKKVYVLQLR